MQFLSQKNFVNSENRLPEDTVLLIKNLVVSFKTKAGVLRAVRGVDLTVFKKQIVGLVGESGSGKSVSVKSVIGFNEGAKIDAESLNLQNIDIRTIKRNDWPFIRGTKVAYIPQDPLMAMNPTKKIDAQIIETIKVTEYRNYQWRRYEIEHDSSIQNKKHEIKKAHEVYKKAISKENTYRKMIEILEFIGIVDPESKVKNYPHEFSGGMRQRIAIAIAIASKPDLIIADEPTTALDVTVQAKVLDLIKKLRDDLGVSIVFISHNIALVANFCDFIYVMYAGKIIERGTRKEIFTEPAHPYTWALISSIPDSESSDDLTSIQGTPPNMLTPPKGDAFAPRNKYAMKIDFEVEPPMFKITETHYAATWLLSADAPRIEIPQDVREKGAIALASIRKLGE